MDRIVNPIVNYQNLIWLRKTTIESVFGLRIFIWIRICIDFGRLDPDPDPGRQK
jgi:hypothetical protein